MLLAQAVAHAGDEARHGIAHQVDKPDVGREGGHLPIGLGPQGGVFRAHLARSESSGPTVFKNDIRIGVEGRHGGFCCTQGECDSALAFGMHCEPESRDQLAKDVFLLTARLLRKQHATGVGASVHHVPVVVLFPIGYRHIRMIAQIAVKPRGPRLLRADHEKDAGDGPETRVDGHLSILLGRWQVHCVRPLSFRRRAGCIRHLPTGS